MDSFKNAIKNLITKSNSSPTKIKNYEADTDGNSYDYCEAMTLAGDVAIISNSNCNYIISSNFVSEYILIPDKIFNTSKARIKVLEDVRENYVRCKSIIYSKLLAELLIKKLNTQYIDKQSFFIRETFESLLNKYGSYKLDGRHYIENVFNYLQAILRKNGKTISFGIFNSFKCKAANDEMFDELLQFFTSEPNSIFDKHLSLLNIFKKIFTAQKAYSYLKYVDSYVYKEVFRRIEFQNSNPVDECDTIQIAIDYDILNIDQINNINDIKPISHSILVFMVLEITLISQKLANFILDISIYPETFISLALEQKRIIEKYGPKFSFYKLKKMKILDSAILESIRLTELSGIERQIENNYILSNGVELKKKKTVKFGRFTHNRNPFFFGKNTHEFDYTRNLQLENELANCSEKNLVWGIFE
ncbi:hypothetical protein BB561_006385 [Smittium simulii]|uniref:Uncharacterized protein n=1 Tax=Smittium simulii TaxID=133385 RepID=A0A2T9Y4S8_9FUNG|nr:hypothetical protein BB561_006385 [Smittium simulii]